MKVSFDLDGTAFERPKFYAELAAALKLAGHQVGVLTGHSQKAESADCRKLADLGFPDMDFYFGRSGKFEALNGAHFKRMVIDREQIDAHFDDYDYDHPDTIRIFAELGEDRVFRVRSSERREWSR